MSLKVKLSVEQRAQIATDTAYYFGISKDRVAALWLDGYRAGIAEEKAKHKRSKVNSRRQNDHQA